MKISARIAIALLCGFFIIVLATAFFSNPYFPMVVLARENSAGTWMSGTLLTFMASLCLFISMKQRWHPWLLFAIFFMVLALDERFMFHEQIKERIIFSFQEVTLSRLVYELPVIIGACLGGFISVLLWRQMPSKSRILLAAAVVLGATSVMLDVLGGGVLWEDSCKLLAELLMACALLITIEDLV